jgi:hypothetical protein
MADGMEEFSLSESSSRAPEATGDVAQDRFDEEAPERTIHYFPT